jgi:hypothetical protein
VVKSAVLCQVRARDQRVDYLRDEPLTDLDVLRVLLRGGVVVGIEEGELRQLAGRDLTQER